MQQNELVDQENTSLWFCQDLSMPSGSRSSMLQQPSCGKKGIDFSCYKTLERGKMNESWVVGEDILKKVELGLHVKERVAYGQACSKYQERKNTVNRCHVAENTEMQTPCFF